MCPNEKCPQLRALLLAWKKAEGISLTLVVVKELPHFPAAVRLALFPTGLPFSLAFGLLLGLPFSLALGLFLTFLFGFALRLPFGLALSLFLGFLLYLPFFLPSGFFLFNTTLFCVTSFW